MRFSTLFAAVALPAVAVLADVHVVTVGGNGTLTFNPSNITANDGDTIAFQFVSKNHTVTQSSFLTPCANFSATGLDSGFQFIPQGSQTIMQYSFNMTAVTGPLWFYCRQTTPISHCEQGMVFSINATPEKTFQQFQQNAMTSVNGGNASAPSAPSGSSTSAGSAPSGSSTPSSSSASTTSSTTSSPSPSQSNAAGTTFRAGTTAGILLSGVGLVAGLVL